jgi:hypothetical protein
MRVKLIRFLSLKAALCELCVLILFACALQTSHAAQWDMSYSALFTSQKLDDVNKLENLLIRDVRARSDDLQKRAALSTATRAILIETVNIGYPTITLLTERSTGYYLYQWLVGMPRDYSRDHGKIVRQIDKADFDTAYFKLHAHKQSLPTKQVDGVPGMRWDAGFTGVVSLFESTAPRQYLVSQNDYFDLSRSNPLDDIAGALVGGGHYRSGYRTKPSWLSELLSRAERFKPSGQSSLHRALSDAVHAEQWEQVKSLLAQGADINYYSDDGSTLLSWAILNNKPGLARQLMALGADPLRKNFFGDTPQDLIDRYRPSLVR